MRSSDRSWILNTCVWVTTRTHLLVALVIADVVGCGVLYSIIEHHGPIEGQWWSIVTASTVGYGDQYPSSTAGRGVGAFLIVSMFVLVLCVGAKLTALVIEDRDKFSHEEQETVMAMLTKLVELESRQANGCPSCEKRSSADSTGTHTPNQPIDGVSS